MHVQLFILLCLLLKAGRAESTIHQHSLSQLVQLPASALGSENDAWMLVNEHTCDVSQTDAWNGKQVNSLSILVQVLFRMGKLSFLTTIVQHPHTYMRAWIQYLNHLQLVDDDLHPNGSIGGRIKEHSCKASSRMPLYYGAGSAITDSLNVSKAVLLSQWKVHRRGISTLEIMGAAYHLALEMFRDYSSGRTPHARQRKRRRGYRSSAGHLYKRASQASSLTASKFASKSMPVVEPDVDDSPGAFPGLCRSNVQGSDLMQSSSCLASDNGGDISTVTCLLSKYSNHSSKELWSAYLAWEEMDRQHRVEMRRNLDELWARVERRRQAMSKTDEQRNLKVDEQRNLKLSVLVRNQELELHSSAEEGGRFEDVKPWHPWDFEVRGEEAGTLAERQPVTLESFIFQSKISGGDFHQSIVSKGKGTEDIVVSLSADNEAYNSVSWWKSVLETRSIKEDQERCTVISSGIPSHQATAPETQDKHPEQYEWPEAVSVTGTTVELVPLILPSMFRWSSETVVSALFVKVETLWLDGRGYVAVALLMGLPALAVLSLWACLESVQWIFLLVTVPGGRQRQQLWRWCVLEVLDALRDCTDSAWYQFLLVCNVFNYIAKGVCWLIKAGISVVIFSASLIRSIWSYS
ncbi:hypothetical protein CEUSTIGMA_g12308.t1 [Chlamydomonas eustigma]|uniref:Uncharacterized protein n=1 Tax=Chlamydomonas eustigma TaxID=1157962 RepID=A0A250XP85_9CHLO|nr:hypothetical protein CEUSTIGMA_g12308.t1 [Chlamydomonas eustigma]|eukprot:GAX84887.1 hypothetical protein CEUSTIGMA_g12308.t1 [Chlamydomonas eustigma]